MSKSFGVNSSSLQCDTLYPSNCFGVFLLSINLSPTSLYCTLTGDGIAAVTAVQCSVPLMGKFKFTYSNSSAPSVSSNTSFISSCNQWNRTHIFVNNSGLAGVNPFHSSTYTGYQIVNSFIVQNFGLEGNLSPNQKIFGD